MIVRQFDDRCEDFIRQPSRCNGTVDKSGKFQMKRVLASEETIRIVVWHIGRVYFVHLVNLSRSKKRVNTPKGVVVNDLNAITRRVSHRGQRSI
ncbi:hypothetical protein [Rhizobium gallicum]|uniref:hypothetical protein n=1 Tax=Rhizobium gallicum TaxID=56730 RepID=UPI0012FC40ED